MKIAIDLTSLDDNFSGIERYSFEITKNLLLMDQDNTYVLIFKNKVYPYFAQNTFSNVSHFVVEGKKLIVNQFGRKKALKAINPDIAYFPAFPVPLLLRKNKTKNISMIHDLVAWDCPKTMKYKSRLLFKTGIKHGLKISNAIMTNSEFSCSRIKDKLNYKKDIYIAPCASYNLADSKIYNFDEVKEEYKLPDSYFLSVGTLEPRKNFDGLLRLYSKAIEQNPDLPPLVIVGRSGWKIDNLIGEFANLKDRIVITGFVDDKYLASIYYYSRAFLYASIYEGFGIPVLEAIRYGTLPIVSDIPTNYEILGNDFEFVFKNNNETSFIDVMNKFLKYDKKQIDEKIDLERKITEKYTWENSAKVLLKAINDLK